MVFISFFRCLDALFHPHDSIAYLYSEFTRLTTVRPTNSWVSLTRFRLAVADLSPDCTASQSSYLVGLFATPVHLRRTTTRCTTPARTSPVIAFLQTGGLIRCSSGDRIAICSAYISDCKCVFIPLQARGSYLQDAMQKPKKVTENPEPTSRTAPADNVAVA